MKPLSNRPSVLEIRNWIDERVSSHTTCRRLVCAAVCTYPLAFTKAKNSLSSFCQEATICQASGNLANQLE